MSEPKPQADDAARWEDRFTYGEPGELKIIHRTRDGQAKPIDFSFVLDDQASDSPAA